MTREPGIFVVQINDGESAQAHKNLLGKSNDFAGAWNASQRSIPFAGSCGLSLVQSIHVYRPGSFPVEFHRLRDAPETVRRHDPAALRPASPKSGGAPRLPNRAVVAIPPRPPPRFDRSV